MQIQTFSIVAGTSACNAKCPFCVSRMTGNNCRKPSEPNWRNFDIACRLAHKSGCTTAMLTGKGEPTLWPDQITSYLKRLSKTNFFPIIEMQTNGIHIADNHITDDCLKNWYNLGLTTIAISICHYKSEMNRSIYTPHRDKYIDIIDLLNRLHNIGFSTRITNIMLDGFIDDFNQVRQMILFAKYNQVRQLTFVPVNKPEDTQDMGCSDFVTKHYIDKCRIEDIKQQLINTGAKRILQLPHGATVYDYDGQNFCWSHCLSQEDDSIDHFRNLIYFPDGRLHHRWDLEGSVIL